MWNFASYVASSWYQRAASVVAAALLAEQADCVLNVYLTRLTLRELLYMTAFMAVMNCSYSNASTEN